MRHPWVSSVLLCAVMASAGLSAHQPYEITVAVEGWVSSDLDVLASWVAAAPPDAAIPDAIVQPGTAAMADAVAAAARLVDGHGRVRLTSGSVVTLQEGDVVRVVVVSAADSQPSTVPTIEIRKGSGTASLIGRADLVVPSGL
jgi:hypothetical protein